MLNTRALGKIDFYLERAAHITLHNTPSVLEGTYGAQFAAYDKIISHKWTPHPSRARVGVSTVAARVRDW